MDNKKFNSLVDELRTASIDTLAAKNAKYAGCSGDVQIGRAHV